ncbi:MAG: SusC/RagA family TonB-linked outer membrane protein, partial [Bacteroidota bacterium]
MKERRIDILQNETPFFKRINKQLILAFTLGCVFLPLCLQAQLLVKGKVKASDEPDGLPGATILLKETGIGTVTDFEGNFEIKANQGQTIVVSFVGYAAQELKLTSANFITVTLEADISTLEEIVVVGYGTQRKSDITGSVASIREADMNPGPVVSASNLLQSTAPGVVLTQASAQPGGGFDVKIRGASSVLGASGPLYVIDGFPVTSENVQPGSSSRHRSSPPRNPLNGINPQDIISIEVLKDASATAIYGARGANGVVLITTKRGSAQKLTLDYSSSFSLQRLDREYDMLNAEQFATVSNEVFLSNNPGEDPIYSPALINNAGDGTNWIDEVTRTGTIHQQQIGGSGGFKNLKYYFSANYFQHRGIADVSELERISGRTNLDYTKDKLSAGLSVLFSRTNDKQVPFGANSGGPEFGGLFDNTRYWSPLLSVRDDDGS